MKTIKTGLKFLAAGLFVLSLVACAATTKKSSTGEYLDDTVITAKVKAALFAEETLKSLQINVETYKGVVQLSGFVDSRKSVNRADEVAEAVPGVKDVVNSLIVK